MLDILLLFYDKMGRLAFKEKVGNMVDMRISYKTYKGEKLFDMNCSCF